MAFCITNINVVSILDDNPAGTCLKTSSNNISIVRGTTFKMIFDLQYQTTELNGTVSTDPADLSGYSVNMSIKSSYDSDSDLLFCSTQNRMINLEYATARCSVEIPVKHTNRLSVGNKVYVIRLVSSGGDTQKIIQGIVSVSNT